MKRLITCLIINIISAVVILRILFARIISYNMMAEQYNKNGSNALVQVIDMQRMNIIIEGAGLVLSIAGIIILITLIATENKRQENRPIMINYDNTAGGIGNTNYISPSYSGGSDHRVDPGNYGGNLNG